MNVNDAMLHSTSFMGNFLLPELLSQYGLPGVPGWPETPSASHEQSIKLPAQHETILIVPSSAHVPLELHIDNCNRRCVALYDSQRIVQVGR
jgi:hypothetical protein